jgi:hypothetical protein
VSRVRTPDDAPIASEFSSEVFYLPRPALA